MRLNALFLFPTSLEDARLESATAACVIISAWRDAFICATFINAKGDAWLGWLPTDAVTPR
jgi:hypothetical protein